MATNLHNLLSGEQRGMVPGLVRFTLGLVEPFYVAAIRQRNHRFDTGRRKANQLPRPVISVGNVTTGGTGKTPMVIDLCRKLSKQGIEMPGILLRGYGNDEVVELTEALTGIAEVEANPDRAVGAAVMLQRNPAVEAFVLDDGFQHRQIARDLDIVLIDATQPWGFGHVLPRGLLREPLASLQRADAVVVTRCDQVSPEAPEAPEVLKQLDEKIARYHGEPPIAHVAMAWTTVLDDANKSMPVEALRDQSVAAVCGLGNPDVFFNMLEQHGAVLKMQRALPDHAPYTQAVVQQLEQTAQAAGATTLVMTQKDWVKWRTLEARTLPVWRPVLGVRWLDGEAAMDTLLTQTIKQNH